MKKNFAIATIVLMLSATLILYADVFSPYMEEGIIAVWSYGTGGSILDVKYTSDVNGDSISDVIAGSRDNNVYLLNGYDGSKIWNKITGGDVRSVDAIADITGDGIKDVVAGSQDGKVYCMNGATGTEIWNQSSAAANVFKVEAVGDITGDGFQEVVVGSGNDDGYTLGIQVLSGSNGEEVWKKTWNLGYYLINYDVAGIPDVTGDGKWDVLMSEDDLAKCYDGTDGEEFWSKGLPKDRWTGHRGWIESIPDISGDDWPDIINLRNDYYYSPHTTKILVLSGPSGEEIWRREWPLTDTTWLRDATYMPDITGDERPEIIVSYGNDVYSLNGNTGSDVWTQSFASNTLSVASTPDISGDGVYDLIIGCEDNKVHIISGWDGSHLFEYSTGGAVRAVSHIPDVTGDNVPDILAGSDDHFVYCLMNPTLKITLAHFPVYFLNTDRNIENTFVIIPISDPHGPCGAAHTMDTMGGVLIAARLQLEAVKGMVRTAMDSYSYISTYDYETGIVTMTDTTSHLIIVASPGVNQVAYYYNELLDDGERVLPVLFLRDAEGDYLYVQSSGSIYRIEEDETGVTTVEYGVIQLHQDPDRYVLIVYGLGGESSMASAKALQQYDQWSLSGSAVIVKYYDSDADGYLDTIEIVETVP